MSRLLIATNNPGKQREYRELLADLDVDLCTLQGLGISVVVREDGSSYAENARIKAEAYAQASGMLTLADDSGLEVDALGGEPGLHSARYGGDGASDTGRYELLLQRLGMVPRGRRTARFRCVIVLVTPDGKTYNTEGICEGVIAFEPRGTHGFGYDPVFYLPEHGQTMAELPSEVKNRISHRGRALQEMMPVLMSTLGELLCNEGEG